MLYWLAFTKYSFVPRKVTSGVVLWPLYTAWSALLSNTFRQTTSAVPAMSCWYRIAWARVMLRRISILRRFEPPERPVGHFPNWKKLVPRKLSPVSIEPRSAVTVVMTPITENTPIVMPSIVRIERSLFTPIEENAILRISTRGIWIFDLRFQISDSRRQADVSVGFRNFSPVMPVSGMKS